MDEKSALIIIYSELDLTFPDYKRFASTLEERKNTTPYEYRLLVDVPEKTIQLKVSANGFLPYTKEVNDIAPKKTIVLEIFEKKTTPIFEKGQFYLTTEPEGAKITIDGYPTFNTSTPYTFKNWTATAYKVSLYKENYYVLDTIMIIDKDKANSLNLKLRAKFGTFELTSDPANELLIDGISYNHDGPIQVAEGKHNITIQRKYFKDYSDMIEVIGQYDPMVIERIIELESYKGRLDVTTDPIVAEVLLDGKNFGETPLNKIIDAGKHILEVQKDNYRTETLKFEILKDETVKKSFELKKNGIIKISGIKETEITLDGKYKGKLSKANNFELPPGNHKIKGELEGYDTYEENFYLDTEVKALEINLIKTEGKFFRFSAIGNERLSQITPRFHLFLSSYIQTINPYLLSSAANYPFYKSVKNNFLIGAGLNYTYLPLIIESDANFGLPIKAMDITSGEQLTNDPNAFLFQLFIITAKIGFCPFVLGERVYPFIGVMAHIVSLDVRTEELKSELQNNFGSGIWHTEPALFINVVFRLGNSFSLSLGYKNFFKNDAFNNGFYFYVLM